MQWYRVLEQLLTTVCAGICGSAGVCSSYSIKALYFAILNTQQNFFNSVCDNGNPCSLPLEEGSPKTESVAVY
jgi:hypothetical protein